MPREYLELILLRDVYHCTIDELNSIPFQTVVAHIACIAAENDYREKQAKEQERKLKRARINR